VTRWAILTGEYPPQPGGVSDYTRLVAGGLAAAGDNVAVYAPRTSNEDKLVDRGVTIHRLPSRFGPRGLIALDQDLALNRPDRILIQYVPHAFGWKAMNLAFAAWVAARAHRFAPVWVMFHEVAFPFGWRPTHAVLGMVTRVMARLVAGAADRVFGSIPAWEPKLRRICPRVIPVEWLPIPSNVGVTADTATVGAIRSQYAPDPTVRLVGHFGTFGRLITDLLGPGATQLLRDSPVVRLLLIGRGSAQFREDMAAAHPDLATRVAATGELPAEAVATHLRACDLLLQPYPDGVTSRRTSVMAGLANGVPIVSNLGFLSEPLWAIAPGIAVAPGPDPIQIAAAARGVLALSPLARAEMEEKAAELYRRTFSVEHTIARLRAVHP
jgi:glycosyltransferase involved in cell wall biosynthesis